MFVWCASTFLSCDGGGVGWSGVGWGGVSRLPHRVSPSSRSTAVSGWQRYSQRKPLLPYSQENKHAALSRCIHYVFSIVASWPRAGFLCRLMRSCAVIESTCCHFPFVVPYLFLSLSRSLWPHYPRFQWNELVDLSSFEFFPPPIHPRELRYSRHERGESWQIVGVQTVPVCQSCARTRQHKAPVFSGSKPIHLGFTKFSHHLPNPLFSYKVQ